MNCRCDRTKINAVHLYLEEHFPDCSLSDVHAPKRLRDAGLPEPTDCHHVVRFAQNGAMHNAVLTDSGARNALAGSRMSLSASPRSPHSRPTVVRVFANADRHDQRCGSPGR